MHGVVRVTRRTPVIIGKIVSINRDKCKVCEIPSHSKKGLVLDRQRLK